MSAASFLTDFADQAVLLPTAVAVGLMLAASGWRRGALAWTVAVGTALAATAALKLAFAACGGLVADDALRNPSGHTAAAAATYGGLAVIAARWPACRVRPALLAACAISLVIGASRVALGAHTVPEVVLGGAIGIAAAMAFARWSGRPPSTVRGSRVVLVAAAAALFLHGSHLRAEAVFRNKALLHTWPLSICSER